MFDDNATYFGAAALAYGAAALKFYAGEAAESVTWFLPDEPTSHAFTDTAALRVTTDFDSYAGPTISCDRSFLPGNSACSADLLIRRVPTHGALCRRSGGSA